MEADVQATVVKKTSTRAVPPVESASKKMLPPKPPLVPPLAISVALPAVEVV